MLLYRAFHIIWIAGQFWMLINRNFHLFKFFIILGWICHAFQFFSFIGKLSVIWKFEKDIYFFIFADNCLCYSMGTFHFRIFPFFWSIFHMIQWKHFNICNFHWLWSIFQAILFYRNSCIFAIFIFLVNCNFPFVMEIVLFLWSFLLLVACTRLYNLLCQSVGPSVDRSVCQLDTLSFFRRPCPPARD